MKKINIFFTDLVLEYCGSQEVNVGFDHPGVIHSIPIYPHPYPDGLNCHWTIHAEEQGFIVFIFKHLTIATESDFIAAGIGDNVTQASTVFKMSGEGKPNSLTLNKTTGWITFQSSYGFWEGFIIELYLSDVYGKYSIS